MAANATTPGGNCHLQTLLTLGAVGSLDDAALMARFVAGAGGADAARELAFAALVERHGATVLRVARTILGDEATALDAFQATFLILAQKARSLRVGDSLAPWLAAVARRVALGARKARARRLRIEQAAARPEAVPASDQSPEVWGETGRAVLAEVDRLPEPYRSAVVACHLDGLTQRAAADRLGWPVGTLQSRLDRGRRKLRARLSRRGFAPSALGLLPPSGLSLALPPGLATTLAQAATAWAFRSSAPPLIAPGVLAIVQTTQGTAMTKLLATVALTAATALGLAATGTPFGVGSGAQDPGSTAPPSRAQTVPAEEPAPDPLPTRAGDGMTKVVAAPVRGVPGEPQPTRDVPEASPTPTDEPIPPPAGGPDLPTLVCFLDRSWEQERPNRPHLDTLGEQGYPIRTLKIEHARETFEQYAIGSSPTFVLISGSGGEIARTSGPMTTRQLAEFYNQNRPQAAAATPASDEPSLAIPVARPRPWETAVRIKIKHSATQWSFGSGTVVVSNPRESLVLTCAHHFRPEWADERATAQPRPPVTIDLFGGKLIQPNGKGPAQLGCTTPDLPAEVVAVNFARDVAVVRFFPGKLLPVAPIVDRGWTPERGMKLITTGCSHGRDLTAWDTKVLDNALACLNGPDSSPMAMIRCQYELAPGRSGGGLFTPEGELVGMAAVASPPDRAGMYIRPDVLRAMLKAVSRDSIQIELPNEELFSRPSVDLSRPGADQGDRMPPAVVEERAGMENVIVSGEPEAVPGLNQQPPPPVLDEGNPAGVVRVSARPDQQRLDELERKLDKVIEGLRPPVGRTISEPAIEEQAPRQSATRRPSRLDSPPVPADPEPTPAPVSRPAPPVRTRRSLPDSPSVLEPRPGAVVSSQEQRLDALERQLDRVLQRLDNIRGESVPFRSREGLGP